MAEAARIIETRCVVIGGGPAGVMTGYLLARAGLDVQVLEKHGDFLRDFRGDTVHPSTMEVLAELGLLEDFLKRPHQRLGQVSAQFGGETIRIGDFSCLKVHAPFIALMPQWEFLDFLAQAAAPFPGFHLRMATEGIAPVAEEGRVVGVTASDAEGPLSIRAPLVIAADGRHSTMRTAAGLKVRDLGAPIDVLWFRVARDAGSTDDTLGHVDGGQFVVTIDRGAYWQCAFVIPKGGAEALKSRPIAEFRDKVLAAAPHLRAHIGALENWDAVKLLSVTVDRLERWAKPGLLCIGDAAHAMSPVGGVGVNMAIQDAVAAANLLAGPLKRGTPSLDELNRVQARRLPAVRLIQWGQVQIQNRVLVPSLSGKHIGVPWFMRLIDSISALQGLPARAVGMGFRPEHVSEAIRAGT